MAHTMSRAKDPNIQFKTPEDFRVDFTRDGKFMGPFAYYGMFPPPFTGSENP